MVLGMLNAWTGSGGEGGGGEKPSMGLFDVGLYGVPYALAGLAYIVVASPYLLPGGRAKGAALENGGQRSEDLLVGARVQPW